MFVAIVEYLDGITPDEIRGYQKAVYKNNVVQFIWHSELLTIPIHRIKSISEIVEMEPPVIAEKEQG